MTHNTVNWRKCTEESPLSKSFQVRPYYEGSEHLCVLWVCPECGAYEFQDFDDYKSEQKNKESK